MKIEVLYFDGCPSHEALLPRLRELMDEAARDVPVELVHVASVEEAERERFLGSPTLRVNGRDVDPSAEERTDFGLKCRLYAHPDGLRGDVPDELIRAALAPASSAAVAEIADFSQVLRDTFPAADDAPLALALLRLLAKGRAVGLSALARAVDRDQGSVCAQVDQWPNVERDDDDAIIGFSGLTLRATTHRFKVRDQPLHTWCAWDTLFLPSLLDTTASVHSTCPITGAMVELVVAPSGITASSPQEVSVSFPPLRATDPRDITSSFCCHVHFLAGADAAASWRIANPDGYVLGLNAAFTLGQRAIAPLLASTEAAIA